MSKAKLPIGLTTPLASATAAVKVVTVRHEEHPQPIPDQQ
jgi:hypothetical protein